jgi:hypothetical protein
MLDERWRIGLASAAGLLTGVRALWAEPPPTVPYPISVTFNFLP